MQFDVAHIGEHFFADKADIEEFIEDFRELSREEIDQDNYIRLYTSEDEIVRQSIRDYVEGKVKDSVVLARIKKALSDIF